MSVIRSSIVVVVTETTDVIDVFIQLPFLLELL